MNRYAVVQIEDLERAQGPELVSRVVSGFRCPKNAEVETFLHRQALPFTRKHVSITYLVFGGAAPDLVGYFSLTHKPLAIPEAALSRTQRKRMDQYCRADGSCGSYLVSAFLVAQFGKNYALPQERRISGEELMSLVLELLRAEQRRIGGQVVFLEHEKDNTFLRSFYETNGFHSFGHRTSETDGETYGQMFAFVRQKKDAG